MASRSERFLANADKCQQVADEAHNSGTKRLFEGLARQWLHLAERAKQTEGIESSRLLTREPGGALTRPMFPSEPRLTPPKMSAIDSTAFEKVERAIERLAGSNGSGKS
jgi:hypothetical protein